MPSPEDLLACPVCGGPLDVLGRTPRCARCDREFKRAEWLDLTPIPPPDAEVLAKWPLWEALQANFVAAAAAVPEHSLSVTARPDADAFQTFCAFSGTVLDVGCGPQTLPTYADVASCRFVGIDPLAGSHERAFEFVQGLGEYLPFRSESFDQVLFATSLDHMLVPRRALSEARRLIRPGGSITVWFGEVDRPIAEPDPTANGGHLRRARERIGAMIDRLRPGEATEEEPAYLAALAQPEGAVDKFHVEHPRKSQIERWFAELDLELAAVEQIDFANGCFMRATKPRGS